MDVLWQMFVTSEETGSKPSLRECSQGHLFTSISDAYLAIS